MKTIPELIAYYEDKKTFFEAEIERFSEMTPGVIEGELIESALNEMKHHRQVARVTISYLQALQKFQGN